MTTNQSSDTEMKNNNTELDIVCFGEALIDFKETTPLGFQGYCGGSPLNVAVAAARLDARVGFASQLSTDQFGDALLEHLHANRVDSRFVLRSDDPSTLAFVGEVNGEAVFDFMAQGAADTRYDPQPRPVLPASTRFVALGSISLLQEPTATSIVEIIAKHRERVTVFFDPNVRPALIRSREAYLAQLQGLIGLSHITKVSTQDLEWLHPGEALDTIAERWLGYGAKAVIITQGGDGVTLFRAGHAPIDAHAPAVDVVDTVGAGDTLSGSLLVALLGKNPNLDALSDDDWREALTFAASAAAFNCTRAGAQPPTTDELQAFMS